MHYNSTNCYTVAAHDPSMCPDLVTRSYQELGHSTHIANACVSAIIYPYIKSRVLVYDIFDLRTKRRDPTQSYDKNPYTHRKF